MSGTLSQQPEPADDVLLTQFTHGDKDAFATLMKRHGPYLLGVCRRVTFHTQDAEDVFQACFLELVRKARSIRQGRSVVGWLHTVAVRLGRKLRARRARHQELERSALRGPAEESTADVSWREVCQAVDEEIGRLPRKLRMPIILCLFREQTQEQAAAELATTPAAVKSRLRRGRALLRARLIRRGISGSALATVLAVGSSAAAVPASLAQQTLQAASALVNHTALAGVVSPAVAALLSATAPPAGWLTLAAAVLGLGLCAVAAGMLWSLVSEGQQRQSETVHAQAAAARLPRIERSFRGGQFDTELFHYYGPTPERYLRCEDEGLRMTLPAEAGPAQPVGIVLRYPVEGDFELEATFDVLQIGKPATNAAGVNLYLLLDSVDREGILFGKLRMPQQGTMITDSTRIHTPLGRQIKEGKAVPAASATGQVRLRVTRQQSRFSYCVAQDDSKDFEMLDQKDASAGNVTILRLAVDPGWAADVPVDARLVDFALTGLCRGYHSQTGPGE